MDPNSNTYAQTTWSVTATKPDSIILGALYQDEMSTEGYQITPALIALAKDGKRSQSIKKDEELQKVGFCVIDALAMRLDHTLLHEVCCSQCHF